MADLDENIDRIAVRSLVPCFLNNLVPKHAEVALHSRMGIAYVEFGKCLENPPTMAKVLGSNVKEDGE
jgi:hypothetical protein